MRVVATALFALCLFLVVHPCAASPETRCEIVWQGFRLPSVAVPQQGPSPAFIPKNNASLFSGGAPAAAPSSTSPVLSSFAPIDSSGLPSKGGTNSTASLGVASQTATAPAVQGFILALTVTPPASSYIYGPKSTYGLPTNIEVTVYNGEKDTVGIRVPVRPPRPMPKKDTVFAKIAQPGVNDSFSLIFPGPALFLAQVPIKDGKLKIRINASGLLCSATSCTPFSQELSLALSSDEITTFPRADVQPWWKEWAQGLGAQPSSTLTANGTQKQGNIFGEPSERSITLAEIQPLFASLQPQYFSPELEVQELGGALFFGLLAGILLNLMPCVLPVISLKFSALMAVSAMTDKKKQAKAFRLYCIVFAAGIMTWFMTMALLVGWAGWAWGEMFQRPTVIVCLALVMFLLGLSLFGVFSLPVFDLKVSSPSHPHWQAFASGLLATLLATPCSGPLLGGVLGWALRQPLPVLTSCILCVGVGMSLPYGILAFFPKLVHLLPRPGAWTIRLEQLLGFLLMASVIYLITLLPQEWMPAILMNILSISFAAWLWGQIGHLGASPARRFMARVVAVASIILSLWWGNSMLQEDFTWEPFDPVVFSDLLGKEQLLVEFTADWCASCKALEHTTLNKNRMAILRERYNMRTIKVDLTRDTEVFGKALLKSLGSASLPTLVLFPRGEEAKKPLVLRDIVTPGQLEEALSDVF